MIHAPVPARILVVGAGAREHALCWRLAREPGVERVLLAGRNVGAERVADVFADLRLDDDAAIVELARRERVDLVVIGPELPLVRGLADLLRAAGFPVFGPDAAAARIEGSKAFCRAIAESAGVPMAEGRSFDAAAAAIAYARELGAPLAVKADGLAAGKGVRLCTTLDEAEQAIAETALLGPLDGSRPGVVVERALEGTEASVIAICDGRTAIALPAARDHKRIGDGDTGANTGGMGAYSPIPGVGDSEIAAIVERFHLPVLRALADRGTPFRGALYAGLMQSIDGPRLLEFNARFGDPETQAIVPRISVPLAPLLMAAAEGRLAHAADALSLTGRVVPARDESAVAVVVASPGYPERPEAGAAIEGLDAAESAGALVFYGGVARRGGALVTAGGRVATVVGTGGSLDDAAAVAYRAAERISFPGKQLRRDVGRVAVAA